VDYALDKLKQSLREIATDIQTGTLDVDYVSDGVSTAQKKLVFAFEEAYMVVIENGKADIAELTAELKKKGFAEYEIDSFIEKKKNVGDLFEPTRGFIKKI